MTRRLLIVTAFFEVLTGVALTLSPSVPAALLLGASLDTPAVVTMARVTGAAMLSLGIACWLARDDGTSPAGRAVVSAILVYNVAVVAVLVYAGLVKGVSAVLLWPAVGGHAALAAWCVACLRRAARSA
jgi:hypothetical protein